MDNRVTRNVALEVAFHEAIIRQSYKDSVGVWTWSVGLTSASGHRVERYIDKPQTMEHCIGVFMWALHRYADDVNKTFEGFDISEAQFAAALSFHWNTGAIAHATWVKEFKLGHADKSKQSFMNWVTPPEIEERRKKERDLFFDGVWSGDGRMTEYTQLTPSHAAKWSSGKKVDVSKEIDACIDPASPIVASLPPKPAGGFFAALMAIFGGRK